MLAFSAQHQILFFFIFFASLFQVKKERQIVSLKSYKNVWKNMTLFVKMVLVVNRGGSEVTGYILGILGFLCLLGFDLLSMNHKKLSKYLFLVSGIMFLLIGSILIAQSNTRFILPTSLRVLFGVMTILFLLLLVYSVVYEVGKNTYQYHQIPKLITNGTYALSRHPGVLWLFGFYLSLGLALTNQGLLLAAVVFTFANTIYVYVQEKIIFIHIFDHYQQYQEHTPFILPNYRSLKAFIYNKEMEEKK